ncbi:vomeronasal type-2 receptor 26-like isoform X3 [Ascaphus truei]|uniref:vomeronasal type-2 receptor 26-like isoform X3 n=1 Tax=Ascaphus truei TaxID=8439 RepID=UPI003F5A2B62
MSYVSKLFSFFQAKIQIKNYQNLLAFVFAINEINKDPELLPNTSLGFHFTDTCLSEEISALGAINMISGKSSSIPNFRCEHSRNMVAFVDGLSSQVTLELARIFGMYKIPQISYATVNPILSDKVQFPSFYRTVPSESAQFRGIVKLLKHFGWTWVGILASDDESGVKASQMLQKQITQSGGCVEFNEFVPLHGKSEQSRKIQIINIMKKSTSQVIIVYGNSDYMSTINIIMYSNSYPVPEKVWIIASQWDVSSGLYYDFLSLAPFNGSLAFTPHYKDIPGFEQFLITFNPDLLPGHMLTLETWFELHSCNWITKPMYDTGRCTRNEKIENSSYPNFLIDISVYSYSIYNAVFALAHALHNMYSYNNEQEKSLLLSDVQPWELNKYLRKVRFTNSAGDEVFFDEHGDLTSGFDIINWIVFPNETLIGTRVGGINTQTSAEEQFILHEKTIQWGSGFTTTPRSVCSEICLPGYRKSSRIGQPSCCYDCIPCPEGEFSNQTDMSTCLKCPATQWSNSNRDNCIDKLFLYLSYEDPLGTSLALISVLFFLLTTLVMGIFIKYQNTPIVKANNRYLSYILLLSLKMCFLCNLIFIGHPLQVTCILRQTVFGVTFSISVSSILAKTVTVIIAFNVTKPGSKFRSWMGSIVSNSIVLFCSLIQVLICAVWLGSSPPFPYYNMEDEIGKILLTCNEGSLIGFYCVLGYMGFLAFISFIVAFLARNLPDSFNEAKFITFSMLVFCSVWISFIPAYMSSKGRYIVAVEIFAILASSAGLLGCIFIPKCYIILLRPERNTRAYLTQKK